VLRRAAAAEFAGTALLLAAVAGSGIMGERLAGGNAAIALLANSLATGGALFALIATFAPTSGAHFNPLVTLAVAGRGNLPWRSVPLYLAAQAAGAVAGVAAANLMFGRAALEFSRHARSGPALLFAEAIATFGLLATVQGSGRAAAVAAYITGAYWFTSSTSFANPAVTVARSLTDTFCGIRPADVPGFVAAQAAGAAIAFAFFRWLQSKPREAEA
jgi:glycerol uptake facilitator-like aquaporin